MLTPTPEKMLDVAFILHRSGQHSEAERVCRRVLESDSDNTEALMLLGVVLAHQGEFKDAIAQFQHILGMHPNDAGTYGNLGNIYRAQGSYDAAIAAYRRSLILNSNRPDAHFNLALVLHQGGELRRAIHHYGEAITLQPDFAAAFNAMGIALRQLGSVQDAIDAHNTAVQLDPQMAEAWDSLGNALREAGQLEEAVLAHEQAIALKPKLSIAHYNLGLTLMDGGLADLAVASFDKAIEQNPHYSDAQVARATALLLDGDLTRGFAEYEYRWGEERSPNAGSDRPLWDGSALEGRRILLVAEQGLGDALQFIRYVPEVANRGGQIIVACADSLLRLFQSMPAVSEVVLRDGDFPAHDVYVPLMSLPRLFKTHLTTIPAQVPYLTAEETASVQLHELMNGRSQRAIGIVWQTRETYTELFPIRRRSCPLIAWQRILELPVGAFFSLQIGEAAQDISRLGWQESLYDLSSHITDFSDTAAIVHQLDLVITVDTAVAHLAGALGKPVWVMLPYAADWRWMIDRSDSPWYPTMRLFRQRYPGDWAGVVEEIREALLGEIN